MTPQRPHASLSLDLQALVAHLVSRLGPTAPLIERQAAAAIVIVDSPTMLDLEVPESVQPVPMDDGPLPGSAIVYDDAERPVGEILVWVEKGRLTGLEQAWFTDEPPTQWPLPADVRLS